METRKAKILRMLNEARRQLRLAQQCRGVGHGMLADIYLCESRAALVSARTFMAAAPASTRRRWKHSNKINARKRVARTLNAAGSSMQHHGRDGMRPIYVNI